MNDIGTPERSTQERVLKLFRDELKYRTLGDWSDRDGNPRPVSYGLVPHPPMAS